MEQEPKKEKTLLLIKPDGTQRGLTGEILHRVEKRGLKIVALKMVEATKEQIDGHYPKDEEWIERLGKKTLKTYKKYDVDPVEELGTDNPMEIGKEVRSWLLEFLTDAPIVKAVVEGVHAIDMVRKLAGDTIPAFADMGTIRGDFSVDSAVSANKDKRAIHNIVHASETPEEAEHEIDYWFSSEEIKSYERVEDGVAF